MSNRTPPGELLDALACGLPARRRVNWLYCMLNCYVDDSGSEPNSRDRGPVFVLAAYVATLERWKHFSEAWDDTLKSGPRPLQYFKMVEAESLREQFGGWSKQERDIKLCEFADLIVSYAQFGGSAILFWDDYQAAQNRYPLYRNIPPYVLLFNLIIAMTIDHPIRRSLQDKVEFIFDKQEGIGPKARYYFDMAKDALPEEIRQYAIDPIHRDDRDFAPLQACDFAAWQLRRRHADLSVDAMSSLRPILLSLDRIPSVRREIKQDQLEAFYTYLVERYPDGLPE